MYSPAAAALLSEETQGLSREAWLFFLSLSLFLSLRTAAVCLFVPPSKGTLALLLLLRWLANLDHISNSEKLIKTSLVGLYTERRKLGAENLAEVTFELH